MKNNIFRISAIVLFLFFISGISELFAQTTDTYTTSGTWVCPAGVTSVNVRCIGGGGAGGGTSSSTLYGGGGGAGGSYATGTVTVVPGNTYTVTVGTGGAGTTSAGPNGNPSWFNTAGTIYAQGGAGGSAPNGGTANGGTGSSALCIGTTVYAGGNGAAGNGTNSGGGGGGAGTTGNGGNASVMTGGTGTTQGGGNGGNGFNSEADGANGSTYGGGGSGAYVPDNSNHNGGNGANGAVQITYTVSGSYCTNTNTTNTSYYINDFSTTGGVANITNNGSGFSTNGYGNFTAMTVSGMAGNTINFSITEVGGTMHFGIWVDWNQDGDFADAGEEVYINNTTYLTTATGSFTVPAGATVGNTRMRVVGNELGTVAACTGTAYTECEDYTFTVIAPTPMAFVSCAVSQPNVSPASIGSNGNEIICIQVVTSGITSPISVTQFTLNANGSTAIADINAANSAKIYYTGTSSTFATTTLFGQNTPTIANFTINGSQTLSSGTNYFWLAYDVQGTATAGDVIDGECPSLNCGGARTPTPTAVVGSRPLVNQVIIGTGTSTGYYPFYVYYGYTRSASLFTAAEVGSPTVITQLAWNISTAAATNVPVKIYLKTTTDATLTADTWANMISGATLVYDATTSFTPTGWKTFDITDFIYCNDNLLVLCEANYGGSGTSPYPSFYYTTATSCHESWSQDSSPPTGNGSVGNSRPNIRIDKTAAGMCSGMPTAGTAVATPNSICAGASSLLTVTGSSTTCGLAYQWQSASALAGPYSDIAGATSSTYTAYPAVNTYYRRAISCGVNTAYTAGVLVSVVGPAYAAIGYTTSFESNWTSRCDTREIPDNFWVGYPVTGNNSWRRHDDAAAAVWSSTASGLYTPVSSDGSRSARFHSYSTSNIGNLDLYIDLSTQSGTKLLKFDYINTSGTDVMTVLLSTDGGATFPTTLLTLTTVSAWTTFYADLASNSSTCVIRFSADGDAGSTDIGLDALSINPACSGIPTPGIAVVDNSTFCNTAEPILSVSGYTNAGGITFQWQSSPTNSPYAWTNLTGGTTTTFSAPSIAQTTYYRCEVRCVANTAYTNILTVTKTAQTITSTNTPVNIACGSTANLTATASGGSILWYTASIGGTSVHTGSPYTTPSISVNTTYYCAASSGSSTESGGMPVPSSSTGYLSSGLGVVFTANQAFTLNSVTIYPIGTGTVTIQLQNSSGTPLATIAPFAVTGNGSQARVVPLGFGVGVGTGYRLVLSAYTGITDLVRDFTTSFPYNSPSNALSVTSGWWTGTTSTNYYMYNLNISIGCESTPRTPVDIVVTGVAKPSCSASPVPANNAVAVCPVDAIVSWAASMTPCAAATSYKLSYGTNGAGDNIMNNVDIGNVLSYNLATPLMGSTIYYWKVVPTNSAGDAVGPCTIWRFTTAANPGSICAGMLGAGVTNVATLPYSQNNSTTAGAGNDLTSANLVSCGNSSYTTGEDKVWIFTPATSGTITITLTSSGSYTGLTLYEGCPLAAGVCGAAAGYCVAAAQSSSGDETLTACVVAGVTYYLVLDSWSTPFNNAYSKLQISAPTGVLIPPNDLPCNATPLVLNVSTMGDNSCAGSAGEPITAPSCWTSGVRNTVWFSVVAPASGQLAVKTNTSTLTDTQIALFGGTCGTGMTQVTGACNNDLSGCGSTYSSYMVVTGLTPGATYYIAVDGAYDLTGSFSIEAIDPVTQNFPLIPGQDCSIPLPTCNNVISVGDPGYSNTGNLCDFSGVGNCTGGERASVWYTINIQNSGLMKFDIIPNDWSSGTPLGDETDYDFLVWRIAGTGATTNCAGILANSATALVACNYSYIGVTGLNDGGNAPSVYGSSYDAAYEAPVPVVAGDVYLICVSNFTQSTSGFTIDYNSSVPSNIINTSTIPPLIVWTGASSTVWANNANWNSCGGLPSCTVSALIPAGLPRMPVITANSFVNNLTIDAGATLTINAGRTLTICGDLINNGTIIADPTSSIIFVGAGINQAVSGNFTGTSKLGNVTINNTGGGIVNFNSNIAMAGSLNIQTAAASLALVGNITANIDGNYTNNGLLTANPLSTVLFSHASNTHTLTGNLSGTSKFGNLTVNKAGGSVVVAAGATTIEIGSNFTTTTSTSVFNTNGKIVIVGGNFSNNNANTTFSNVTGTLIFNGAAAQTYTNTTGTLTLNNVTMNHTGPGVTINNNMVLGNSGTLTLTLGRIITGGFMVIVNYTASAAVTPGNVSSYVQGNLRRYIPNATGSYDFPVGHAAKGYQRANFNFTTASTVGYLTAFFSPYAVVPGALGSTECGRTYDRPAIDNGYWTVTANANPNSGKYTCTLYNLNYTNSAGSNTYTVMSDHTPAGTGPWQLLNGDGSNGTCVAGPVTAVVRADMCGFSKFGTAASSMGPLPITLLSFTGKQLGTTNMLEWITASEQNNDYFSLERSNDGVHFSEIALIDGAGNSNTNLYYSHPDKEPFSPISYYKLKQVDFDGQSTYSDIVALASYNNSEQSELINLYPNPASTSIFLELYSPLSGFVKFEIVDMYGRTVYSEETTLLMGNNIREIEVGFLAKGAYFAKVTFITTGNSGYKRFVKQ